ncbi:MAG TPA: M67 family metallopeptidase [Thermoplasmata archaeon]
MHSPDPAPVASGSACPLGSVRTTGVDCGTGRSRAERKAVSLPAALLHKMKAHARETYPEECCGFLIGEATDAEGDGCRTIIALERARNDFEGPRRRRFLIPAEELREVERRIERSGRAVVGFYHSHPDQPARPSRLDQDNAWPGYSYVVLAVTSTGVPAARAFELDPDSLTFREVRLPLVEAPALAPAAVGG